MARIIIPQIISGVQFRSDVHCAAVFKREQKNIKGQGLGRVFCIQSDSILIVEMREKKNMRVVCFVL